MKIRFRPLIFATATVFILSSCSSGTVNSGLGGAPATDGTFRFALQADPGALNPLMTAATPAHELARLSYDYLVDPDPETGVVGPWLAEEWYETPTSAKFVIRDGVTCSDGSALTAQTVANNIRFVTDEANGSALRGVYVPSTATATVDVSTRTVTVSTPDISPFLLLNLAQLPIMCDAGLKDPAAADKTTIGSGMFQITEVVANDHYTYMRREGYSWGPDDTTSATTGVPKKVVVTIVTNASTSTNQLLSGELNAARVGGADQDRLRSSDLVVVEEKVPAAEMFFNHTAQNATSDPAVRKALVQAIDLDDLAQVFTSGRGTRSTTLVSLEPRACVYDSVAGNLPDFNSDAAKATLDAAGWTVGADGMRSKNGTGLKVRLTYEAFDDSTDAAADLAQQAWASLGVEVELIGGDSNKIVDMLLSGKDNTAWDIAWEPLIVGVPSMLVPFLSGPAPSEGLNFSSIKNEAYDEAVSRASGLTGDEACNSWETAESEIVKSISVVPIADRIETTYFNKAGLAFGRLLIGSALRLYQ